MAIAVLQQGHRHLQAALADQGGLQVIEELEGTDTALKALGAARDKALAKQSGMAHGRVAADSRLTSGRGGRSNQRAGTCAARGPIPVMWLH